MSDNMYDQANIGRWSEYSRLILHELKKHSEVIESFNNKINVLDSSVNEIKSSVTSLHGDISSLVKVVRDGNGTLPLVTRVSLLENEIQNIMTSVEENTESTRWRWQNIFSVFSILIALATAVFTFLKRND